MSTSLFAPDFLAIFNSNRDTGGPLKSFPSPADWRDQWIYFLMVDRFNNSSAAPRNLPFNAEFNDFQGGNLAGIQDRLPYLKQLGAGAIWLSPVLANMPLQPGTYHGYGIHDFLHVDTRFARDPDNADNELRSLVDAAHNLGMYVILDIVLNHTGDAFAYVCDSNEGSVSVQTAQPRISAPSRALSSGVIPKTKPTPIGPISLPFQTLLADRSYGPPNFRTTITFAARASLEEVATTRSAISRPSSSSVPTSSMFSSSWFAAYQYVIARFDIDGYRIDTLRYLKNNLPLLFGNSIREFALSIGKKNFFTFGEVFVGDAEQQIARFIGRTTTEDTDMVGVDAALDYPLFNDLKPVVKGLAPPSNLAGMYILRKQIEANVLSSHGDATRYFVTFLDNHDVKERIRYVDPTDPTKYDDQVTLGLACLYCLPGIPCLYYGTEQGLHGVGSDLAVREALWGGPGFSPDNTYYHHISQIAAVRRSTPALRYGRFYFRPISGDKQHFGVSPYLNGVLAFSRILMDREIVVVANTDTVNSSSVYVIVDNTLNNPGTQLRIMYSNKAAPQPPGAVLPSAAGTVQVQETNGSVGSGPLNCMLVTLAPLEVQILGL